MAIRRRFTWQFAVAATLVLTCLVTLTRTGQPGAPPFSVLHNRELVSWLVWLVLAPGILVTARQFQFNDAAPINWLAKQVALGAFFSAASILVTVGIELTMQSAGHVHAAAQPPLVSRVATGLLIYVVIAVLCQVFISRQSVRDREAVAEKLRADLAEARLATLEGQLHPHFLFNSLNSIAALMRSDARQAETMLEQLSELLRATLRTNPMQQVPLDDALRIAEQYLAIERVRFQERLQTSIEASEAARTGLVPQLILQPLVENAVRHGIAPLEAGGTVRVTAQVLEGALHIVVEDNGQGYSALPNPRAGSGLGLRSVRSTLSQLYGADHQFEVAAINTGGTRVRICMPWRTALA